MLAFLFGLLLVIIVIALAIRFKWVRWLLLIPVVLVVILIAYFVQQASEQKQETEASKHRISGAELELTNLGLSPANYGTIYQLTGRVQNHSSRYSLTGLTIEVTLQDCLTTPPGRRENCDTIGQATDHIYSIDIPPGQVRGIQESVYFSNVPPIRGKWAWSYRLVDIEGR